MTDSFYDVLDVAEDASTERIRSAYRAKVKEIHPDVSDASDAQERFKRVTRAKEVLTDEAERERYDRLGHHQYVDDTTDGDSQPSDQTNESSTATEADTETSTEDPFDWDADDAGSRPSETRSATETAAWQRADDPVGDSYTTRTEYTDQSVDEVRVPMTPRTVIQIGTMLVMYPVFLVATVFPPFPTIVNVLVGFCTLFVIVYLLSLPRVAVFVFGTWGFLLPLLLVLFGVALSSLWGIGALVITWVPFGIALLTRHALRV